ncbi:MAG: hypothetical protein J7501_15060, partial [Bdellovibrio sp.]|nr:hypothetical protein [Bdellovibrio sp.]
MLLRFFLLSIICWTSCVYAQGTLDKDNRPKLSDEEVDQRLGKGWKGIIYICNPYCEFAAIREDGSWNPPLDKIPTDWAHTKLVAQTDPLYPLLVARSPVLPFTTKKLPHVSSEEESGKITPPKYAIYNFNWGYSIAGGFLYSQSNWTGNTELQTDLSSKGIQYMPFFQMQLFKGTPSKLWSFWIQHEFDGYYGLSPGYKAQDSNITASSTQYSLSYQAWLTFPKFKIGPRMTYDTESW